MENPGSWGNAERVVNQVLSQAAIHAALATPVTGLSLERQITDALRAAGLLAEETASGELIPVFRNINEDGMAYDQHDTLGKAMALLRQFPNDSVLVTLLRKESDA